MVMVTNVLRRSTTTSVGEHDSSIGYTSRRSSTADGPPPRRSSLAGLSLRISRSKRSKPAREAVTCCETAAQQLGEAFFSLPDEIIVQILCYLGPSDVFALRLTSQFIYSFLQGHAAPIARSLLVRQAYERSPDDKKSQYTYNYIQTLYPHPLPCISTDYLLQMLKRQSQIDRMLSVIASYVHMKIYMIPSCPRFDDFAPYEAKLICRLHLAAWTLYHFLEKYREMLVFEHPNHPAPPNPSEAMERSCRSCTAFVRSLLPSYPGTEIIPAYYFYELCRQHLRSLSRAPAYAGSIERRLRGWSRKPPSDADLATLVVLGGIPELCKLNMLKGTYNQRIEVIGSFVDKVHGEATRTDTADSSRPGAQSSLGRDSTPISFPRLKSPLAVPLQNISHETLTAVPDLDSFVIGSDEWVTRMFELVGPEDQIVSAFGFVQNVLAGKWYQTRTASGRGGEGEPVGSQEDDEGGDLDFLAPVKGFD
ncbi:hypothetical protein A1O3_00819 [Capronia epimyces CBS 606.96]|uniref:F-box domain-containing protein n=1 Tax=Capronia epimyces CBS 606.96 TaxID=1182542 RepID=W9ZCL3_9EURO|nr:uncharacterized protein A1O3_00819 [Capronia epimyces CBS 606.96]EXJ92269.1 hypothetical protein A1O3_00819 [Capronia epimyces CBS 606.96]